MGFSDSNFDPGILAFDSTEKKTYRYQLIAPIVPSPPNPLPRSVRTGGEGEQYFFNFYHAKDEN